MKQIMFLLALFLSLNAFSQQYYSSIEAFLSNICPNHSLTFFEKSRIVWDTTNRDSIKIYHTTSLFEFTYYLTDIGGEFELFGKRYRIGIDHLNKSLVLPFGVFNLYPESAEVYGIKVRNRAYIVISGFSDIVAEQKSDVVIFNIFDITDENVEYYIMRSSMGDYRNIGDFNNDGILDFIVTKKLWNEDCIVTFYTLYDNNFIVYSDGHDWVYSTELHKTGRGFIQIGGYWFNGLQTK